MGGIRYYIFFSSPLLSIRTEFKNCSSSLISYKCKLNVKHRECLRDHPSQRLMIKCFSDNNPDRIGIWKCWFLRRRENRSTWRKTSRSKEKNQQQIKLNPHMTPHPGIPAPWNTLVTIHYSCPSLACSASVFF